MIRPFGISEAGSLALHAMAFLASQENPSSTRFVARQLRASPHHLAKVLGTLARQGLLISRRGPIGGFILARRPHEITLLDVLDAAEGRPAAGMCIMRTRVCRRGRCMFRGAHTQALSLFRNRLKNISLAEASASFTFRGEAI